MHLDPDFKYLTYGDRFPRGKEISTMKRGDFIAFYAGLKPIIQWDQKLVYALIGLYFEVNALFKTRVKASTIRAGGKRQRFETLINEDVLLLEKYLRNEKNEWTPRI